eukprot:2869805-Prymnesium_polylepis.1
MRSRLTSRRMERSQHNSSSSLPSKDQKSTERAACTGVRYLGKQAMLLKAGSPPVVSKAISSEKKKTASKAVLCYSCDCMLDNEKGVPVRSDNIGCDYCDRWSCWPCADIECETNLPDKWACDHCKNAKRDKRRRRNVCGANVCRCDWSPVARRAAAVGAGAGAAAAGAAAAGAAAA